LKKIFLLILVLSFMLSGCFLAEPEVERLEINPKEFKLYPGEKMDIAIEAIYDNDEKTPITSDQIVIANDTVIIENASIYVTNSIETDEKHTVEIKHNDVASQIEIEVTSNPLLNYEINSDGKKVIVEPDRIDVIVNKELSVSKDFSPKNLVVPDIRWPSGYSGDLQKKYMREEAAIALEKLFKDATSAGHKLYGVSGYRSYDLQKNIFAYNVGRFGSEEEANKISARPGESEHHTGLVMDISAESVGMIKLVESFGESPEGKWVAENCSEYGFIIRYLKGKEDITGYNYEPWHLRYVGVELAKEITNSGLTMEEYFGKFLN